MSLPRRCVVVVLACPLASIPPLTLLTSAWFIRRTSRRVTWPTRPLPARRRPPNGFADTSATGRPLKPARKKKPRRAPISTRHVEITQDKETHPQPPSRRFSLVSCSCCSCSVTIEIVGNFSWFRAVSGEPVSGEPVSSRLIPSHPVSTRLNPSQPVSTRLNPSHRSLSQPASAHLMERALTGTPTRPGAPPHAPQAYAFEGNGSRRGNLG